MALIEFKINWDSSKGQLTVTSVIKEIDQNDRVELISDNDNAALEWSDGSPVAPPDPLNPPSNWETLLRLPQVDQKPPLRVRRHVEMLPPAAPAAQCGYIDVETGKFRPWSHGFPHPPTPPHPTGQ